MYLAHVHEHESEWLSLLLKEINTLMPLISLPNCVLDLATVGADPCSPDTRVICIEINPLAEFAGEGLFNWVTDKPILLGKKAFEFRILRAIPPNPTLAVHPQWAKIVVDDAFWRK